MIAQPVSRKFANVAAALSLLALAACSSAPSGRFETGSLDQRSTVVGSTGQKVAEVALQHVGTPYRYGGATPKGFDCSGLVQYAYSRAGKRLPRTTGQLWTQLQPVPRQQLQAGDVLFFRIEGKIAHVGLYLGDSRFVHAPSSGRTVTVATLDAPFYAASLIRAGRPQ